MDKSFTPPIPLVALIGLCVLLVLMVYFGFVRPWHLHWGASAEEAKRAMPGDNLVAQDRIGFTQAVTIQAPVEKVWPWLVQIGFKRAGWYSYDQIEGLLGAADFVDGHRSANRIVPELQDLKLGDQIAIHPAAPFTVEMVEPNRLLALAVHADLKTNKPFDLNGPKPENFINFSWVFMLEPVDAKTTRLIVRWRSDYTPSLGTFIGFGVFVEGGSFLMQPKMLLGLKERAEKYQ